MTILTLTADNAHVQVSGIGLLNNVWGHGSLLNGTDYTQTITYDPALAPTGVSLAWDWPDNGTSGVLAYPELMFGFSPWQGTGGGNLVSRLADLRQLTLDFDLTLQGATQDFNVAVDIWLTSAALGNNATIRSEVLITLHDPDVKDPNSVAWADPVSGYSGRYSVQTMTIDGQSWQFIAMSVDADYLSGSVDLSNFLKTLMRDGLVSGSSFVSGVELGCEVWGGGAGGMVVNDLGLAFSGYHVTRGADLLLGTRAPDDMRGAAGNDSMNGFSGNDLLQGGAGDDILSGQSGADRLFGGAGNDVLAGQGGADTLRGGDGADHFFFAPLAGTDTLRDFHSGEDKLDLTALRGTTTGALQLVGTEAFAGQGHASLRARAEAGGLFVQLDANGDGRADLALHLQGVSQILGFDLMF